MNNNLNRYGMVVFLAASLLSVAVVTGLSMVDSANASSWKDWIKQKIEQKNSCSNSASCSNSGSNCINGVCQRSSD